MNRRLVGLLFLLCALSLAWPQTNGIGADAAKSAAISAAALSPLPTLPAPPPINDSFVNATFISGASGSVLGTNVGATKEPGEPNHADNAGGASVWWTWTAPFTGNAVFDTRGSGLDSLLAVYTGSSVNSLTLVNSDDDISNTVLQSRVVFPAVTGVTYKIAVDGYKYNGTSTISEGAITLNWAQAPAAPANDLFANAEVIGGTNGSVATSTTWASREPGEPVILDRLGGASVWWSWTAPAEGYVKFNTSGSGFYTILGVYTGSNVASLTEVASSESAPGQVLFPATAGTTYFVTVDGFLGATGHAVLNWAPSLPPNDLFANAILLAGTSGHVTGSNVGATLEAGEPQFVPYSTAASVWWSWTAPTTGSATIDTIGSDFPTALGVATGSGLTTLTYVAVAIGAGAQSSLTFETVAGTSYRISVEGLNTAQGDIQLNYSLNFTTYTLTYAARPHGSLTGVTSQVVIAGKNGTPVTAVPDLGFYFQKWSDGSTANPRTDPAVTGNIDVTPIFAQKFLVQFVTDGTPGATLEGLTPNQLVFDGADSQPVVARAPTGYRFVNWTLNGTVYSAFNPVVASHVASAMTLQANFVSYNWPGYAGPVGVVCLTSGGIQLLDPVSQTLHGPYFASEFGTDSTECPLDVAVTPDGKTALVTTFTPKRIRFIDLSTPTSPVLDPTSVTLSFAAEDIAITPDGRHALVTDGVAPHIGVIDVAARTLTQDKNTSTSALFKANGIAVATDGQTVLAVDYYNRKVASYLLDPVAGELTQTAIIDVRPFGPINVEFSPDGKTAIVATATSGTSSTLVGACPLVLRVDAPGAVTYMGPVSLPPHIPQAQSVAFSRRTGDKAYYYAVREIPILPPPVFGQKTVISNEIEVLNVNGPGLVSLANTTITLPLVADYYELFGIDTLAAEPSGRYLYTSNFSTSGAPGNFVGVVDLLTNTETATIPTAPSPATLPLGLAFPAFDLCHVTFQTGGTPGASLTGATSQTVVAWTPCTPVTAVPPAGYTFLNWTGDIPTTTSNPLTVRPVAANLNIVAHFAAPSGTVVVNVIPTNAPWSFTDGNGATHSGTGPTTATLVPVGPTALTWLPLANYTAPAQPTTQTLTAGGMVTFSGVYTPVAGTGAVLVTIDPAAAVAAGAEWRLVTPSTTSQYFFSGHTESGLDPGSVTVEFKPTPGWTAPSSQTLTVVSGQTTVANGTYTSSTTAGGALQITILPAQAVADGAQWRRAGTTTYLNSGDTDLVAAGTYAVEFKPVLGWTAPADLTNLVVVTGNTTMRTATYTPHALPAGAPGDYKISYSNCKIATDATTASRGLIVTQAHGATIKIQKLTKVPAKHANVPGKTLYMLGSPGLDYLTAATGTIKSLSGTGAFIPTVTANITDSVKMGVTDASFAAPFTSILPPAAGLVAPRAGAPALKVSLTGVSLDALVTAEAASIKLANKKTKTLPVAANVPAGAQIVAGPGLSLGVTGGDMLADLVQSSGGIKSLSVSKGGMLGRTLDMATLGTILTSQTLAVPGLHPATVVVSGLHAGPWDEKLDGMGKVSADIIYGIFVAGGAQEGALIQPTCGASVQTWNSQAQGAGDAFVKTESKTKPSGITEHTTAP